MNGVLLLHKPSGMTSHDCVNKVRKLFHTKKVGHTGTLDPDVSGVLPICIGKATKIAQYLTASKKTYVAEVTLGIATTTEDASGEIIQEKKVNPSLSTDDVLSVLHDLTGNIKQTPPMYSAVKVNGKKLYEYARECIDVERPTRTVTIYEMNLLSDVCHQEGKVSFKIDVSCSKGTYIRTLAVMIGEKLGYPAHMSHLVRTQSGVFSLQDCLHFSEIEQFLEKGRFENGFLSICQALNDLPKWTINDTLAEKVKNGAVLPMPDEMKDLHEERFVVIYQDECIALYKKHPTKAGFIKPEKVLLEG
ncbi:tRNA pseudouridine(55) synthase TruB [Bacillus sp. FJAT-47783]|uniref:tRNA pseudouridine(55) synthase TruB n=1 Tax=Bacillus sp. FJAT-47783 TaxID=2922712 RepID=UPI001FAD2BE8|nr:tRNA pseudouridine(55) synthase TruB [Bacillus sp. FJAT-47783]